MITNQNELTVNTGHIQAERELAREQVDTSPAPYQDHNFAQLWEGLKRDLKGQNTQPK